MTTRTGIDAQVGTAEEAAYGTRLTPTRFHEFIDEGLALTIEKLESKGIRSGSRVLRSDRRAPGRKSVGGPLRMELLNKSFGLWLKHMLGSIASAQPDAAGAPTVWRHTGTPGDMVPNKSLTVQVGRPDASGTTQPFTYEGCKVASWELASTVGDIAVLSLDLIGEDESTDLALGAASYPASASLLTFVEASLTVAGSPIDITDLKLAGNNGLKDDRYKLSSALRKEPVEAAMREYTGEANAYFDNLTAYNRFVTGTDAALVAKWEGATISGAFKFFLEITENVEFDGDTPTVSGPEEIMQPLKFKALDSGSGSASAITAVYQTTDAAP